MTFLFWNLATSDNAVVLLGQLAREHAADVVVVAECLDPGDVLRTLNTPAADYFVCPGRSRVEVYTRFSDSYVSTVDEGRLFTLRRIDLPARPPLLLAAAHLPSGLQVSLDGRNENCREFSRRVQAAEAEIGVRNTVVIGDLNLNPFDAGVAFAGGFHAVSDRRVALRGSRTIQERAYPFFYNPMWRFFGDHATPAGTYFHWRADYTEYFWHLYDQVLLRPGLLPYFRDDGLLIPVSVGGVGLLDPDGRPGREIASDHLPLVLRLDL